MNKEYALAGKGLWFLFLAEILGLASKVVRVIPLLGWIVYPILLVVAFALQFIGPYTARSTHPGFQNAFYMALIGVLVGVLSAFVREGSVMVTIISLAALVVSFLVIYFVCTAAGTLLAAKGDVLQADRANFIWKLYAACTLVDIAATLVMGVPVLGVLAKLASYVSMVVSTVAAIMMILFLYTASQSLRN